MPIIRSTNLPILEEFQEKIKGVVYGSAFGDAYGFVTEFMDYKRIIQTQPQIPKLLKISDDTQMSIYTLQAAQSILGKNYDLEKLSKDINLQNVFRREFAQAHVRFYYDIDNNRAPGLTCMSALGNYIASNKETGREGSNTNNSKGCGTIMRAPWLGLIGTLTREEIFVISAIQSQTTHGHPASWLSSALTSVIIRDLFMSLVDLSKKHSLVTHAAVILEEFSEEWYNLTGDTKTVQEFRVVLNHIKDTWYHFEEFSSDVTLFYGEGWTADEAFYTSIATASLYTDSPRDGIKRLVYTNGDSDSLASIGGAFLGAINNYDSFNYEIAENLEKRYQVELRECTDYLISTW